MRLPRELFGVLLPTAKTAGMFSAKSRRLIASFSPNFLRGEMLPCRLNRLEGSQVFYFSFILFLLRFLFSPLKESWIYFRVHMHRVF